MVFSSWYGQSLPPNSTLSLMGYSPVMPACGVCLWSRLVISTSNYVPVNTTSVNTCPFSTLSLQVSLLLRFSSILSFILATLAPLAHQGIIKSVTTVTRNPVKHEPYPLFSKKVSAPSIVSAVTSGPASDFGGHFSGHISVAVSKVSAIFVSGADTSDTLDTSGRDKGVVVFGPGWTFAGVHLLECLPII